MIFLKPTSTAKKLKIIYLLGDILQIVQRITDVALIVESCNVFYFMYFVWQFYKQNAKALVFGFHFCVDSSKCDIFGVTQEVFSSAHLLFEYIVKVYVVKLCRSLLRVVVICVLSSNVLPYFSLSIHAASLLSTGCHFCRHSLH